MSADLFYDRCRKKKKKKLLNVKQGAVVKDVTAT